MEQQYHDHTFCLCCNKSWNNQIPEYERAVVFGSTLDMAFVRGPGLIFVLPFLEKVNTILATTITITASTTINIIITITMVVQIRKIDTRTSYYEIPPQQILSTDSVTLTVDAVSPAICGDDDDKRSMITVITMMRREWNKKMREI